MSMPLLMELSEKALRDAVEQAARQLVLGWADNDGRKLISQAVEKMLQEPEVLAALKAKLIACINEIKTETLTTSRRLY